MFHIPEVSPSCRLSSRKNTLLLRGCFFITGTFELCLTHRICPLKFLQINRQIIWFRKNLMSNADFGMLARLSFRHLFLKSFPVREERIRSILRTSMLKPNVTDVGMNVHVVLTIDRWMQKRVVYQQSLLNCQSHFPGASILVTQFDWQVKREASYSPAGCIDKHALWLPRSAFHRATGADWLRAWWTIAFQQVGEVEAQAI